MILEVLRFVAVALLATGLGVPPAPAAEDSSGTALNCAAPTNGIEVIICSSPELAALNEQLMGAYKAAEQKAGDKLDELKSSLQSWVKARNACWKDPDRTTCASDAFKSQTALLQARYGLKEPFNSVLFDCNEGEAGRIKAVFYETDPATVVLTRGDETVVAPIAPSGSGARYLSDSGVSFWNKGEEATVEWPAGTTHTCHTTK